MNRLDRELSAVAMATVVLNHGSVLAQSGTASAHETPTLECFESPRDTTPAGPAVILLDDVIVEAIEHKPETCPYRSRVTASFGT